MTNIGFGADATHTCDPSASQANLPTVGLTDFIHPDGVVRDHAADRYVFEHHFGGRWLRWPLNWVKSLVRTLRWLKRQMI